MRAPTSLLTEKKPAIARIATIAGGQGLEPRLTGPKPVVLPLDDPPMESTVPLYSLSF